MTWTAGEIRELRCRMGWSQAEFARSMNLNLNVIAHWETGLAQPDNDSCNALWRIAQLVESNSEKIQRRPIAEWIMRDRGLSQIHDLEVLEAAESKMVRSATEKAPLQNN